MFKDILSSATVYIDNSLIVSEQYTGDLSTSIALTNPIEAGKSVYISFKVKVTQMPNPNPINNLATVNYSYIVNPNNPTPTNKSTDSNVVKVKIFRYDFSKQITDIINSIAKEEAALSNIEDAEGLKTQKAVAMNNITQQELLCINNSVQETLDSINILQSILRQKLEVLNCHINGTSC